MSIQDKLNELKHDREIKNVNFFNDGTVNRDELGFVKNASTINGIKAIYQTLMNATESYSLDHDFDLIEMGLLLGLIYDKDDVLPNDVIKEDSKPLNGIVRFYTGSVKSYLDGKQANKADYFKYGLNRQGFVVYEELVRKIREENLIFNGPETFEEFERLVLTKKPFDISVSAILEKPMSLRKK